MPVYIGKSGDLVRCYRCLTDRQTTEYRATQLLSSIQLKLSHAIILNISLTSLVSVGGIAPFVVGACVLVVGSVEKLNM